MTESEWLTSTDPVAMLWHLSPDSQLERSQVSDRKLRLFACACLASLGRLRPDREQWGEDGIDRNPDADGPMGRPMTAFDWAMQWAQQDKTQREEGKVGLLRAAILRDIVGNPFRPMSITKEVIECHWLGELTVSRMAKAIYDSRHFEDMPILADALEDAGCSNADILAHCRKVAMDRQEWQAAGEPESTAVTHVRGCWVLDLILGRE